MTEDTFLPLTNHFGMFQKPPLSLFNKSLKDKTEPMLKPTFRNQVIEERPSGWPTSTINQRIVFWLMGDNRNSRRRILDARHAGALFIAKLVKVLKRINRTPAP
jgi:hypothetical protein